MSSATELSLERSLDSLRFNLGADIMAALGDPDVQEVFINPDNTLWVEKHGQGMKCIGRMEPSRTRMIITLVAAALGTKATVENPVVEGELPLNGLCFEGIIPPNVSNPILNIRKKADKIFALAEYVSSGIMPGVVKSAIEVAITGRKNILVVGGTGSGKTTLVNGIIHAMSELAPHDRLVIFEDTYELQSASKNVVFLHTSIFISMQDLLRASMRLRPDRIIVGEVRGGEALTLLKSWNTGHGSGVATVHANSAYGGLTRLEQLISEATPAPMQKLIAEAVDLVVYITRDPEKGRIVREVIEVDSFDPVAQQYNFKPIYIHD